MAEGQAGGWRSRAPAAALCALVVAGVGVAAHLRHQDGVTDACLRVAALVGELGVWGLALYSLAFVFATSFLVPTSTFELAAGFLFTPPFGIFVALFVAGGSKLLASTFHYLMGRSLLRGYVKERLLPKYPMFESMEGTVATDAWKVAVAVRFAPIPTVAKNLGLAALGVPLGHFVVVTAIVSVPWTVAAVVAGSTLTSLPELLDGGGSRKVAELVGHYTGGSPKMAAAAVGAVVCAAFAARSLRAARAAGRETPPLKEKGQ